MERDIVKRIEDLMDLFDEGEVTTADKIERPEDPFRDFNERNPMAGGGMLVQPGFGGTRQGYKGPVKFENIITPKIYEGNRFTKKMPPGTYSMRLYEGEKTAKGTVKEKTYVGTKKQLKKIFDKKNRGRVKRAKSELGSRASYNKPYKVLQGKNKGKYMITYGGGSMSPKVTNYFDPKKYGSDKAAYNAANKELTDYKNRPDKYKNLKENFRKTAVQPEGFVTGQKMLKEARKKGITVSKNRQPSSFADNFGFPKKRSGGVMFYDISKLDNQKEVDKILKAQIKGGAGSDFAIKKFPLKGRAGAFETRKEVETKKLGVAKGSPLTGKRKLNVDKGHAGNIFSKFSDELITLDKLTYTPSQINEIIGEPGGIDDKIKAIQNSQFKVINKMNDADAFNYMVKNGIDYDTSQNALPFKQQLLNKSDATLTRLVLDSGGEKVARLSDGTTFGGSFLKNPVDPLDEFKGMTEVDFQEFRRKYLTNEGNLQRSILSKDANKKRLKINLAETDNIPKELLNKNITKEQLNDLAKLKIFEENRISSMKAAQLSKQELNNALADLAAKINPGKCGRKTGATGGRVGLKFGSTACGLEAKKYLDQIILRGTKDKSEQLLANKILTAGRSLKDFASIRGTLGPAALAFTAATEAGLVGYDMLAEGKTFREAVGDSIFNYALGPKLKIDSVQERNKRFRKLGVSEEDMGKIGAYESALQNIEQFDKTFEEAQTAEQRLKEATDAIDPTLFPGTINELQKNLNIARANVQDLYRAGDPYQRLAPAIEPTGLAALQEAQKLATVDRLTSSLPRFLGKAFPKYEESRQQRILDASSVINPAFNIPGMREATGGYLYGFARGGLSGGDTSGPPPERGPNPQGLPSLLKRVRNI